MFVKSYPVGTSFLSRNVQYWSSLDAPRGRLHVALSSQSFSTHNRRGEKRSMVLASGTSILAKNADPSNHYLHSRLANSQMRTFKTTAVSRLTYQALGITTAGLLKSSSAIVVIVAMSHLFLTVLPLAFFRTLRVKMKTGWHKTHLARLKIPSHVSDFYRKTEMYMEKGIQPDRNTWHEVDTPTIRKWKEIRAISGRRNHPADFKALEEWAVENMSEVTEPDHPPRWWKTRRLRLKDRFYREVYAATINISRQRTGLEELPAYDDELRLWNPWQKHWMFYLPEPSPEVMEQIKALSEEDRLHLFRLRRWATSEGLYTASLKRGKWLVYTLVWLPIGLFTIVALLSIEKVPFTGRYRVIMLSPEEEDVITNKLKGPGWYKAVLGMFTTPERPAPPTVQLDDWRWNWVNGVLRRLEKGVEEYCAAEREAREMISPFAKDDIPRPPPPAYPLHPRARATSLIHSAVEGYDSGNEHLTVGPPYSLLLLEDQERNAMSYGFGDGGSGGVVIYTGIMDEILAKTPDAEEQPSAQSVNIQRSQYIKPDLKIGWFAGLRTSLGFSTSTAYKPTVLETQPSPTIPVPTDEQTLQLALILAHELSHLVLSHHLESLSWSEVVLPNATGLGGDLVRTILYPITFFLGPFVNDKIKDITKRKAEETSAYSDVHFSVKQEREADVVSLRLLAYAGFNPEAAVKYWSADVPQPSCTKSGKSAVEHLPFQFLRGGVHDERETRFQRLLDELAKWKKYAESQTDRGNGNADQRGGA